MNSERRKQLKSAYAERRPEMGVVCWQCGEQMWIMASKDTRADYNSTLFQLQAGNFVNRQMQAAFQEQGEESFHWRVLKVLEYDDPKEDHWEDLELLLMECQDEYPQAQLMRKARRRH